MATIIDMRTRPSRSDNRHGGSRRAGGAEVVIFPGVRYERWEEDAEPPAHGSGKRARDLLELDD